MLLRILIIAALIPIASSFVDAQEPINTKVKSIALGMNMGYSTSIIDLSDRFGAMGAIGAHLEYLSGTNWYFNFKTDYFFGNDVKENVLANLRNVDGLVIGNDKAFAELFTRSRAWTIGVTIGNLIPLSEKKRRSGLLVGLGVGVMRHKVRIQDDSESVAAVLEPYLFGYDRLTSGVYFEPQIMYYSNESRNSYFKYFIGIKSPIGFTEGLRTINYSTMSSDKGIGRLDGLLVLNAGFLIELGSFGAEEQIYY